MSPRVPGCRPCPLVSGAKAERAGARVPRTALLQVARTLPHPSLVFPQRTRMAPFRARLRRWRSVHQRAPAARAVTVPHRGDTCGCHSLTGRAAPFSKTREWSSPAVTNPA